MAPGNSRPVDQGPSILRAPRRADSRLVEVLADPEDGPDSASAPDLERPAPDLADRGLVRGVHRRLRQAARNALRLADAHADSSSIPRPRKAR